MAATRYSVFFFTATWLDQLLYHKFETETRSFLVASLEFCGQSLQRTNFDLAQSLTTNWYHGERFTVFGARSQFLFKDGGRDSATRVRTIMSGLTGQFPQIILLKYQHAFGDKDNDPVESSRTAVQ